MEFEFFCLNLIKGFVILLYPSWCLSSHGWMQGIGKAAEVCYHEDFHANCRHGEMILMNKALFGRMRIGRCVKKDLGFLGCQSNVLNQMDQLCTGKQRCEILNLGKPNFDHVDNLECTELQLYLEVQYSCVTALDTRNICKGSDQSLSIKDSPTFVHSDFIKSAPCMMRHMDAAFKVVASQGQQINISVIDLEVDTLSSWKKCVNYGTVRELKTMQETEICGGQQRKRELILSNSNAVEIRIDRHKEAKFMLEFSALGCPDIPSPPKGWRERQGNKIILGCYNSKQTWQLTCEENRWVGVIGNCSSDMPKVSSSKQDKHTTHVISSDVWLALIIACGVIVAVSSITFGIVCWRRRTLEAQISKMKASGKISNDKTTKKRPESEYMFPNFRPRSTMSETEDAVYDFCFSPGSTQEPLPNNMTSSVTLPCRGSANIQYNNMVPYPAPPESPKYKTLIVVKA